MIGIRRRPEGRLEYRWIIAAGGYRTGSTLQYNLIGEYLELHGLGRRRGLVEPDDVESFVSIETPGEIGVVKCHHSVDGGQGFERPTAWADQVGLGNAVALISRRNVDDVRRSMVRKFGLDPLEVEASRLWTENEANQERWRELDAIESSYDDMTVHPVRALRKLVRQLGLPWDRAAAHGAAQSCSLDATRATMSTVEVGEWDPVTLLHADHVDPERFRDGGRSPNDGVTGAN